MTSDTLTDDALQPACDFLLAELCGWSQEALYAQFDVARQRHTAAPQAPASRATASTRMFEAFTQELRESQQRSVAQQHPALMQALTRLQRNWITSQRECLERLTQDRPALERFVGQSLGPLVSLTPGLSDAHRGGRTVTLLEFVDGTRIIYKPRPVDMEQAFERFALWTQDKDVSIRAPRVLSRDTYGWLEHIAARPCQDIRELTLFYQRMGALAAGLYVLAARDAHAENVIACGDQPVLVDAECLAHPTPFDPDKPEDGLVATQLLPLWHRRDNGRFSGLGGMATAPSEQARSTVRGWVDCNTDTMHATEVPAPALAGANLPHLDQRAVAAHEHSDDIVQGFESMWSTLAAARDALLEPQGVLQPLFEGRGRFVLRPTQVYADALLHWQHRDAREANGASRDAKLEELDDDRLDTQSMLVEEQRSLQDLCIPRFDTAGSGCDLVLESGAVQAGAFGSSNREQIAARMATLEGDTQQRLTALLRTVLGLQRLSNLL